jgi:transcriptional regulator with XRE-family HTH domain
VNSHRTGPFGFTPEERREYEAATLRFTAAAHIQNYLDNAGLQAKDLARRVGKSRAWISKLLSGRQNATLDTLSDAAWALGARWQIDLIPAERTGTPAQDDPPAPHWATSTTVTLSEGISNFVPGSAWVDQPAMHDFIVLLSHGIVQVQEHSPHIITSKRSGAKTNSTLSYTVHGNLVASKPTASSATASLQFSGMEK